MDCAALEMKLIHLYLYSFGQDTTKGFLLGVSVSKRMRN